MATKQNIEYDTLLHCSPVLTTQIAADPQAVSLELVAKGLIPPSLQGSAQQPAGERANALVQQILNKVKDFPRNFKVFMDILAKFPWLQDVVQLVNDESRAQRQDAEVSNIQFLKYSILSCAHFNQFTASFWYL